MKICWILRTRLTRKGGQLYSDLAGVRLRSIAPAIELQRLGHETLIVQGRGDRESELAALRSCEVAVVGQLLPTMTESVDRAGVAMIELVEALQRLGIKIVADIHDHHFETPGKSVYFKRLVRTVDTVVAASPIMAQVVANYTNRPVQTIAEPYEGPHGEVKFAPAVKLSGLDSVRWLWKSRIPGRRLKLTWFGHPSNLAAIYDLAHALVPLGRRLPFQILIVCAAGAGVEDFRDAFNRGQGHHCRVEFSPWSMENTWLALGSSDLVVIPSDVKDLQKAVKSGNRLIETLRAGRYPIVNPIPSYQEFAGYAWMGNDVAEGIEWAIKHPHEVREQIRRGQAHVEQHFSAAALGRKWEAVLGGAAAQVDSAPAGDNA